MNQTNWRSLRQGVFAVCNPSSGYQEAVIFLAIKCEIKYLLTNVDGRKSLEGHENGFLPVLNASCFISRTCVSERVSEKWEF